MSTETCVTTSDLLREYAANPGCCEDYAAVMCKGARELERLQRIIDSRPVIDGELLEAYTEWSREIYAAVDSKAVGRAG